MFGKKKKKVLEKHTLRTHNFGRVKTLKPRFLHAVFPAVSRTTCQLVALLLRDACADPEAPKHVRVWVQAAVMLAAAWAFGGPLDAPSREAFDDMYKTLWKGG